jgi:hypothetical protein
VSAMNGYGHGSKGGEWRVTQSLFVCRPPAWGGHYLILWLWPTETPCIHSSLKR